MKSSEGDYWVGLDHVRALAALLVFSWHFMHGSQGLPVPHEGAPAFFPLALFDEGHTGVAVFMTLSGYLFAKILDGRAMSYPRFLWNRLLRLAPLLIFTRLIEAALIWRAHGDLHAFAQSLVRGLILPAWTNGGWSIAVELHFYLLLPFIMALCRRDRRWLIVLLCLAIMLRWKLYDSGVDVGFWSYWTIVGHIDEFLLGILCFVYRRELANRGSLVAAMFLAFCAIYWSFDVAGGFYHLNDRGREATRIWIILPTLEGLAYGSAIALYDAHCSRNPGKFSMFVARTGSVSYSLYLLHSFLYPPVVNWLIAHGVTLASFYVWLGLSIAAFFSLYPLGWASFHLIEAPFLRLRMRYLRDCEQVAPQRGPVAAV